MSAPLLRRRRQRLLAGGVALLLLALLPLPIGDVYTLNLLILTLLYVGLSQAWNILGGSCGQISLGHALYFGAGAYVSTLLYVHLGVPPSLGLFAGGGVAAVLALAVGWPCFRLSGHYYAIATIVVAVIFYLLALNADFLGGASGIYIPFKGQSWAALQFRTSKLPFVYLTLAYAALVWLLAWIMEGTRAGFYWRAVKDDPIAARSLAVRVLPSKLVAAGLSGFATGVGGAIYAQYVGYIDPDSVLSMPLSILIALPAVLGGVGTLWGPLLGAALLIPLSELSRSYLGGSGHGVDLMLYGGLIMLVALWRPEGLLGLFTRRGGAGAHAGTA